MRRSPCVAPEPALERFWVRSLSVCLSLVVLVACSGGGGSSGGGGNGNGNGNGNGGGGSGGASADASIAGLVLSAGTLVPAFHPEVFAYTVDVPSAVAEVKAIVTAADPAARITVAGQVVASGAASTAQPLVEGANSLPIGITAADGVTTRMYAVTVTRDPVPALSALGLSVGTLSPVFAPDTTSYGATVGFLAEQVTVTATTAAPGATLTMNGFALVSGQPSAPVGLAVGLNTLTVRVTTATSETREYQIALTRQTAAMFAQEAYVKASNADVDDQFGVRVALSGDTMAVSTWFEDSSATGVDGNQSDNGAFGSGAVYVFTRSGTTWTQQAYLKASNAGGDDAFGFSVAVRGDMLAVGAINEDSGASGVGGNQADDNVTDSGAVYVFTRSGTTWSQQAYVKASNPGAFDAFGYSVALDGDTLAVAARDEDSSAVGIGGQQLDDSASGSGAVYVFTHTGATWAQQAYVKASNTGAGDRFGQSVALSGDTLVVGAPNEDGGAVGIDGDGADNSRPDSGAVYVFLRSGATWAQQAYVKASNTDAGDQFGFSVALFGDTLAAGAATESSSATGIGGAQLDNLASHSGAVYVFTRGGGPWTQQAYLKASNTDANDQFGISVALADDRLAVGAVGESSGAVGIDGFQADNTAISSGAAYLFTRSGTTWMQRNYVKAANAEAVDLFGQMVALNGDTLVVGALGEDGGSTGIDGNGLDNSRSNSGAVYVFR